MAMAVGAPPKTAKGKVPTEVPFTQAVVVSSPEAVKVTALGVQACDQTDFGAATLITRTNTKEAVRETGLRARTKLESLKEEDKKVAVLKTDIFFRGKMEQNDFRDFEVKTSKSEKRKLKLEIFLNLFVMSTQLQKVSRDVERV